MKFFGRHHVRSSVYHIGFVVFIAVSLFNYFVLDSPISWYEYFCLFYALFDYIAEMYDPHPDNPGPWFRSHFHRFCGDDEDR